MSSPKFCSNCQMNKSRNVIRKRAPKIGDFHKEALALVHALGEVYHNVGVKNSYRDTCFKDIKRKYEYHLNAKRVNEEDVKPYLELEEKLKSLSASALVQRVEISRFIQKVING